MKNTIHTSSGLILTFIILVKLLSLTNFAPGINSFTVQHPDFVALVALACATVLIYSLIPRVARELTESFSEKKNAKEIKEKLSNLSLSEKHILSLFVTEKKIERVLDPNDAAVAWLEAIRVIFNTGKSPDGKKIIYRIMPLAMKLLTHNPNWLL